MNEQSTEEVVRLWQFTMPAEANYGRFFLSIRGKTVEIRMTRQDDGAFTVAVWGEPPPLISLDDIPIGTEYEGQME